MVILDVYSVLYKNENIGYFYVFEDYTTELNLNREVDINCDELEEMIQNQFYSNDLIQLIRVPWRTNESFIVDTNVHSKKDEKICMQYSIYKLDDGSYEVELLEGLFWNDNLLDEYKSVEVIPDSWFSLEYKEFLEKVVSLANVSSYFDVDSLLNKEGLKDFLWN